MNDADIIKALECFAIDKDFDERQCVGCAFETKGLCCENCSEGIAKASLDLINRQKAEIEKLKGYVTPVVSLVNAYDIEVAKAEARKELAGLLKTSAKGMPFEGWWCYVFDIVLKKMEGEINV